MLEFHYAVRLLKRKYLFLDRCFPHLFGLVSEHGEAFSENHFFFSFTELRRSMTNMAGCFVITSICVIAWKRTAWVASILAPNAIQTNVDQNVAAIGNGFMTQLRLKLGMSSACCHFLSLTDFVLTVFAPEWSSFFTFYWSKSWLYELFLVKCLAVVLVLLYCCLSSRL